MPLKRQRVSLTADWRNTGLRILRFDRLAPAYNRRAVSWPP